MQNNANAAVVSGGKTATKPETKTVAEKASEKIAEKRRALGRGLASLLPGPRAVPPAEGAAATGGGGFASQASATSPTAVAHASALAPAAHAPATSPTSARTSGGDGETTPLAVATTPAAVSGRAIVAELHGAEGRTGEEVWQIPFEQVDKNPHQTRLDFTPGLAELAASIRAQGVLQPIVVRPNAEGRYTLILGERRLRAAGMAGLETIPAIVKRVSEQQAAEMTLVENLQRQDLNCVDMAAAFAKLSTDFAMTQEQIGARVGVSRETVANYMRLLTLPESVLSALVGGRLTFSHARVLMQLGTDPVRIWSVAKKAIDEKLTVAKLEQLVMGTHMSHGQGDGHSQAGGARWVDPNVKAAQRSLEEILGMRVRIRDRQGRGKIVIEYATIDDFDRVVTMLKGK